MAKILTKSTHDLDQQLYHQPQTSNLLKLLESYNVNTITAFLVEAEI
jgi:hypothetical protein